MWSNTFGAASRARATRITKHPLFHSEAVRNAAIRAPNAVQLSLDGS
jgi:hypothetical protein